MMNICAQEYPCIVVCANRQIENRELHCCIFVIFVNACTKRAKRNFRLFFSFAAGCDEGLLPEHLARVISTIAAQISRCNWSGWRHMQKHVCVIHSNLSFKCLLYNCWMQALSRRIDRKIHLRWYIGLERPHACGRRKTTHLIQKTVLLHIFYHKVIRNYINFRMRINVVSFRKLHSYAGYNKNINGYWLTYNEHHYHTHTILNLP